MYCRLCMKRLPLTVIESLACGDRVVMTRLDGVADWLEDMLPDTDIRYMDLPKMKGADEAVEEELPVLKKDWRRHSKMQLGR